MRGRWIWFVPLALAGFAAFVALGGFVVMKLWNALLPGLFGWPVVSFGQALGLLVLCRILFGGLAMKGGSPSHLRRSMRERWERMTDEEKERVRRGLRDPGPPGAASA